MPQSKKRPLARQRPKSREETPKEGGGNADALPHEGILGTGQHKMQEASHRLLTYSRTSLLDPVTAGYAGPPTLDDPVELGRRGGLGKLLKLAATARRLRDLAHLSLPSMRGREGWGRHRVEGRQR